MTQFTSMELWYSYVRNDEFVKLTDRHPTFPKTVLMCACLDYQYDIVEILLDKKIEFAQKYNPNFTTTWVEDRNTHIGMAQKSIDTKEDLLKKFNMVRLLIDLEITDEISCIPKFLKDEWDLYNEIHHGIKRKTKGHKYLPKFIGVGIAVLVAGLSYFTL